MTSLQARQKLDTCEDLDEDLELSPQSCVGMKSHGLCDLSDNVSDGADEESDLGDTDSYYSQEPLDESATNQVKSTAELFDGSVMTLQQSNVLIKKYVSRHNISDEGLKDLLQLIKLHCPIPNTRFTSPHIFHKEFHPETSNVVYHYYCSKCLIETEEDTKICLNQDCHNNLSGPGRCSFIEVQLIPHLCKFLQRKSHSTIIIHVLILTQ